MTWSKLLLVPTAIVLAGAAGSAGAAPGNAVSAVTTDTQASGDVTLVHHNYWHSRRQWERRQAYRYHYRPYRYNYRPRCYWSNYYHRTICR